MKKYLLLSLLLFIAGCASNNSGGEEVSVESESVSESELTGGFYFVGTEKGNPSVYYYSLSEKRDSLIWTNNKEKVIDLSAAGGNKFFFLTSTGFGKKGVFPFVNNIRLYLFNGNEIVLLKEAGNGIQAYAELDEGNYKVTINDIDKTVAGYIEQNIIVYNDHGKLLFDESKRYDLTTEGFPVPERKKIAAVSPLADITISEEEGNIYLVTASNEKLLIKENSFPVRSIEWFNGDKVIISLLDVSPSNETLYDPEPETSSLIIYSLKEKKPLNEFTGGGYKNYIIHDNILIFDDGFKEKSFIRIYNISNGEIIDTIKKQGGAGIKNIPEPPDYSA